MNFVQVAIPSPLRQTFTYKNQFSSDLIGKRVLVEFGRRKLVGIVISQSKNFDENYKLKQIEEVLDDSPLFDKQALKKIINIAKTGITLIKKEGSFIAFEASTKS